MLQKKLKFIGIGAYRSGTTWLTQCLREHPEICIPQIKELEFFNSKDVNGRKTYHNFDKGIEWYEQQFKNCDKQAICWGEFSNAYLYDEETPQLIKKTFPDLKFFLCLRDPVDRAYSDFLWFTLNFQRAYDPVFDVEEFKRSDHFERSMYSKYIKRYIEIFGRENIHLIIYQDIIRRPEVVIEKAYNFLEVESFNPPSLLEKVNVASKTRNKTLTYLFDLKIKLEEHNLDFLIHFLKRFGMYSALQNFYVRINRKPIKKRDLNTSQKNKLRDAFKDDIKRTEELLNIDLSTWI